MKAKILVLLVTTALSILLFSSAAIDPLRALSVDLSLTMRAGLERLSGTEEYQSDDVVIVAVDEETYRTPPFSDTPKVMWTPQLGAVQDKILESGASVLGYDIIFPTTIESYIPGYEREFLRSLARWGRQGKLILGQAQHAGEPVAPYPAQILVNGGANNLRSLNLLADEDEVTRRLPLYFRTPNGEPLPSMSLELAKRSGKEAVTLENDGSVFWGKTRVPGSDTQTSYLNFRPGQEIPTYSFADLYHCLNSSDSQFFERTFANKVVLIGVVVDVEDRRITSKRFINEERNFAPTERCTKPAIETSLRLHLNRNAIPGVYIHAKATDDLINQSVLSPLNRVTETLILVLVVCGAVINGLVIRPAMGVLVYSVLVTLLLIADQLILTYNLLLPSLGMITTSAGAYAFTVLFQYVTTYRRQAKTRKLFELYLDPAVINTMMDSESDPELGGERRVVTLWFSDVANFTSISENLSATELVGVMNAYFTVVTRLIEEHGGFVDKYIGDAVVGVFGAPLNDPHHAGHAVSCALQAQRKLARLNANNYFGDVQLTTRIGINTGEVVVGNIGSDDRFNYTVMGDEVNLASRLEGANKVFGSLTLISSATAERLPKSIITRKLATIRVKGKHESVSVFEPIDMRTWDTPVFFNPKAEKKSTSGKPKLQDMVDSPEFARAKETANIFNQIHNLWAEGDFESARELLLDQPETPVQTHLLAILNEEEREYLSAPKSYDPVINLLSK